MNFHEVIHGKAYNAPMEFLEQVLPEYKKPKLGAKPIKPEPTMNYLTTMRQLLMRRSLPRSGSIMII